MPVEYYSGDLFADPSIKYFAHGCNCRGAMGKGIAVQFKKRWPEMFSDYKRLCKENQYRPGNILIWVSRDGTCVFNLMTQWDWWNPERATLKAIEELAKEMLHQAYMKNIPYIAMSKIGAGLGGVEWNDVRAVLEPLAENSPVELRVVAEFRKGHTLTQLVAQIDGIYSTILQ